ncbi:MAG TPA: bifunctional precorrin-2 dehydrogenase/sirohydrochlorin ferrochelatase [Candidatus Angelobacter sp.]|jgi:precorrin-2 dehydrogenase/sirohydrochlorin ferrochelatase|nr:bifunctional precorrin-2 dehydrogenase/sirohydrochlorin ferrochelatase [Candidatus Angelobacter sp.]
MALYPIFLKLEGRKVLIAGGGRVAEEKIYAVLRSAKDVTVVAPKISAQIRAWAEAGLVQHIAGEYQAGMAAGFFLVIACTDSEAVNRQIYEEAQQAGVLCNAVDDPGYCDFYAPAVVSRGDFQIAISTGGNSPALAQRVRKKLEVEFGPEYESWIGWLGRMREGFIKALPRSQRRIELLHLLAETRPATNQKPSTEAGR